MATSVTPLIVVHGAPELSGVPQAFWLRLVEFVSAGRDGSITWHFAHGKITKLQATDYIGAKNES